VPETIMDEFDDIVAEDTVIKHERLELILMCCHPALPLDGSPTCTGGWPNSPARAVVELNRAVAVAPAGDPAAYTAAAVAVAAYLLRRRDA
jgi:predicted RNA polymerase sigma factor